MRGAGPTKATGSLRFVSSSTDMDTPITIKLPAAVVLQHASCSDEMVALATDMGEACVKAISCCIRQLWCLTLSHKVTL